jgi:predicted amidohydrolase YtcJ
MQEAHLAGWQIGVHTQGDRALREALEVLESVTRLEPVEDRRHRFEHLMLADPGLFKRMAQAGMTTSFHVQHIYYYGEVLRKEILGEQRIRRLWPLRSAALSGTNISLHSDHPMFPSAPMELVQTAVTRRTRQGDPLALDQSILIAEALRAMTINPAWQVHDEKNTGSIAAGKFADLVILSQDPLEARPEHLGQI